jgi:hypothetical protein
MMLKRLGWVLAGVWAVPCLWAGFARPEGILAKDFITAFAPLVSGWLLLVAGRFVATGTVRHSPAAPHLPQPEGSGPPQSSPRLYLLKAR